MWIWNNSLAGVHSIRAQGGFLYLVYFIFLKLTAVVGKIDLKTGLNKCLVFCCIYGRRVASMNPEWEKAIYFHVSHELLCEGLFVANAYKTDIF